MSLIEKLNDKTGNLNNLLLNENFKSISIDEGYNTDHMNQRFNNQHFNCETEITTNELQEITQTLQLDMVSSEAFNSVASLPSSATITTVKNSTTNNICGVVIVDEPILLYFNQINQINNEPYNYHQYKNAIVLGSVIVDQNYNGEELRRNIQSQLSPVLPQKFIFLTKEGWPVLRNQESKLNSSNLVSDSHIITITKSFDKPKIGISNIKGDCFGFVFCEYSSTLRELRETINEQFKELGIRMQKIEYKFLERHGWPVASNQELILTVLDIIVNQKICIQSESLNSITQNSQECNINKLSLNCPEQQSNFALPPVQCFTTITSDDQTTTPKDAIDSIWRKQPSFRTTKSGFNFSIRQTSRRKQEKVIKVKSSKSVKPIMISYARQEAAQHALDLKRQLVSLGFSVYLDIDEIQKGSDWQDSLNEAVLGCDVFVPLVTPMYGRTQWTNREVKLADLLKKYIVPINFLDTWPPECLAIQFATTQYIHWKPDESDHVTETQIEKVSDVKVWSQLYIERVSKLVANQVMTISTSKKQVAPIDSNLTVETPSEQQEDRPLIVISAHPQQKSVVNQIRNSLKDEGYNVWCSTDTYDDVVDTPSTCSPEINEQNSFLIPNHLSTITEDKESNGSKDFEKYKEMARKIVETSKQRPKSLPLNSEKQVVELKKSLRRMISNDNSSCHYSSLTPDKMNQFKVFQEQVSKAQAVIVVASDNYLKSRTSQKHVYYCEHRKKIILVKYDYCNVPAWFTMLLGNHFSVNIKNVKFMDLLKAHIKRTLNPMSKSPNDHMHESKMQYLIDFMKTNLSVLETCIYIVGSTKMQNPRSEEICKLIGCELAKVKNIQIVTSGFYGAGDLVAKSFYEARQKFCFRNSNPLSGPGPTQDNLKSCEAESSVVHIVPVKESQDVSSKCRQNEDGTFESIPYGKTLFLGESIKERESAVARLIDTCILIEGGPSSAHEIQEFIWNDHFVIPMMSTGGAAAGQYGVPEKIFNAPHGVSESDWAILSNDSVPALEIAKATVRIVVSLKEAIAAHKLCRLEFEKKGKSLFKSSGKSSGKKKISEKKKVDIAAAHNVSRDPDEPNSPEKMLPVVEDQCRAKCKEKIQKGKKKWKRINNIITFSRKC